eukprot:3226079-Pleurochrysis_carterae.AAC.1
MQLIRFSRSAQDGSNCLTTQPALCIPATLLALKSFTCSFAFLRMRCEGRRSCEMTSSTHVHGGRVAPRSCSQSQRVTSGPSSAVHAFLETNSSATFGCQRQLTPFIRAGTAWIAERLHVSTFFASSSALSACTAPSSSPG